jgi:hypothetical protein
MTEYTVKRADRPTRICVYDVDPAVDRGIIQVHVRHAFDQRDKDAMRELRRLCARDVREYRSVRGRMRRAVRRLLAAVSRWVRR